MDKKSKRHPEQGWRRYYRYLILVFALLFLASLLRNILIIYKAKDRIDDVKSRVERLKDENQALKDKLAQTQSPEFVEIQLRDKLGLSKEGEIIVVLPDEDVLRKLAPRPIEEEETLPDPTWKKWLKLFL